MIVLNRLELLFFWLLLNSDCFCKNVHNPLITLPNNFQNQKRRESKYLEMENRNRTILNFCSSKRPENFFHEKHMLSKVYKKIHACLD